MSDQLLIQVTSSDFEPSEKLYREANSSRYKIVIQFHSN